MKRTLTAILIVTVATGVLITFAGAVTAQEANEQTVNQDASNAAEQTAEVTNGSGIQVIDQDASNLGVQSVTVTDGGTTEQTINQDVSNAAEQSG